MTSGDIGAYFILKGRPRLAAVIGFLKTFAHTARVMKELVLQPKSRYVIFFIRFLSSYVILFFHQTIELLLNVDNLGI